MDGLDRDITSDIATRITFEPLGDFTAAQVKRFAEFTAGDDRAETYSKQAWDPYSAPSTITTTAATSRRVAAEVLHKDHDLVAAHKRVVARQWAQADTARTEAA